SIRNRISSHVSSDCRGIPIQERRSLMADKSAWASLFVFMAGEAYRFLSEERVAGLSASRNAAGTVFFLYRYIGMALPYGMGRPDCSDKVQKMCLEQM